MTAELDVALIHHPTGDVHRPILFPAMGIFSLADTLERNGIRAEIVHLGVEKRLKPDFNILDDLAANGARIVALSAHWFFQLPDSLELARQVKAALPDAIVVVGGFTASFFAKELVEKHKFLDVVVRGDGELPLLRLCEAQLGGNVGALSSIPNLVFRDSDGRVKATPFEHTVGKEEFAAYNFSNLKLLRHHKEYLSLTFQPTKRFKDRLSTGAGGIFPLQTGRGCPFNCTYCGGSLEAQRRIFRRERPLFRPVDGVLVSIREVMEYGCKSFYICFDPERSGAYYRELFKRIRREKLELRMAFGCWNLPSKEFLDEFKDTFIDGSFEISPETGNQALRDANKGATSFTNQELRECLAYIEKKDLICQLYFGYFLSGDTLETVMETQRYARSLESDHCESFYLAFSTDPASRFYLSPKEHDIDIDVHSLEDYLEVLSRDRLSPNLLAHRPSSMSAEEAQRVILTLGNISFVQKVFPRSIRSLELALKDPGRAEKLVEDLCLQAASRPDRAGMEPRVDDIARQFQKIIRKQAPGIGESLTDLLGEIIAFEAWPYSLLEERFSKVSAHYSVYCTHMELRGDQLAEFLSKDGVITAKRRFQHDVRKTVGSGANSSILKPVLAATMIGMAVDSNGRFATFYPDKNGTARRSAG